jgi:amino acid transporter
MSKVNANRVPWVAVLVQSIISAIITAVAFIVAPYVLKTGFTAVNLSTDIYWILQAAVTVIWCISMVLLFVDVIIIRSKYRDTFARIRLAPDWVFYLCSALGLIASAVGVWVIFLAPWTTTGDVNTQQWIVWISSIAILSLIVGVIVFFIGQATIRKDVSDEDVIAEVTT